MEGPFAEGFHKRIRFPFSIVRPWKALLSSPGLILKMETQPVQTLGGVRSNRF